MVLAPPKSRVTALCVEGSSRDHGSVDASALVARTTVRSTWRSLVVLGVLAGLTAGLAMAALSGARRSASAWDRLRDETLASDAIAFASQVGVYEPDWSEVMALPYVEAAGAFGITLNAEADQASAFVNVGGDLFTEVDRPRVLEGRLAAPDAADEVVIARPTATDEPAPYGLGDTITLHLYSTEQLEREDYSGEPEGPTASVEVVGITDSPFERTAIPAAGSLMLGEAFWERYGDRTTTFSNLMVRLENGQADVARFTEDVARIMGSSIPVEDLAENSKRVTNGTQLEASGLVLFAVAVVAAGVVLLGQALVRSVRSGASPAPTLSTMGMTRAQVAASMAMPYLLASVAAIVVGAASAIAGSWWFPIGLARQLDPDLGIHLDWPVIVPGLVLVGSAMVATAWVAAWRAAGPSSAVHTRPAWSAQVAARSGLPVTPAVGASLALDAGSGRRAVPVRAAMLACAVGVLGVVGALTIRSGIDDAVSNPERFGVVWDALLHLPPDPGDGSVQSVIDEVIDDDRVDAVAAALREHVDVKGRPLPVYATTDLKGSLGMVAIEGRIPITTGEIAIGPATAKARAIDVGDSIPVGPDGDPTEVVGLVLLPQTPHSSFDQGAVLTAPELERMVQRARTVDAEVSGQEPDPSPLQVAYAMRVDPDASVDDVAAPILEVADGDPSAIEMSEIPADAENLRNVRTLPLLFAAFTVFLAVGALAHVTASTIRRRRGEIAVLRALGLTPRQARRAFSWQGSTLAFVGLAVGIPLGILAGTAIWRWVARATPVVYVSPVLWWVLVVAVPATLLIAVAVAALPGGRAARLHLGETLRAE